MQARQAGFGGANGRLPRFIPLPLAIFARSATRALAVQPIGARRRVICSRLRGQSSHGDAPQARVIPRYHLDLAIPAAQRHGLELMTQPNPRDAPGASGG